MYIQINVGYVNFVTIVSIFRVLTLIHFMIFFSDAFQDYRNSEYGKDTNCYITNSHLQEDT